MLKFDANVDVDVNANVTCEWTLKLNGLKLNGSDQSKCLEIRHLLNKKAFQ